LYHVLFSGLLALVAREPSTEVGLTERDLSRWKLIEDFKARLAQAAQEGSLHPTWSNSQRLLGYDDYLSLFLFGLLNPAVRTLRAVCEASNLQRVQREICSRPVSLGSFSEAQAVLDPALLSRVFASLSQEVAARDTKARPNARTWIIQDGSLFEALPRMYWALWRRQGQSQAQVRLHLGLNMAADCPAQALVTPGKHCERAALRTGLKAGEGRVCDRYYAESYKLLKEMPEQGVAFVMRLRDEAILEVEEELPLSEADRAQNVIRDAWVGLGSKGYRQDQRLRVVWVQIKDEVLRLVTDLGPAELSAAEVALMYKQRWQVELFFRWIKCILGCRHWLAESPEGVTIEIYLALIAALLLQLYLGQRPTKRLMEMIQLYLLGVASLQELWEAIQRQRARAALRKKS
jgi:hypothetical protein